MSSDHTDQSMELLAEIETDGDILKTFHWGLDKSSTRGELVEPWVC